MSAVVFSQMKTSAYAAPKSAFIYFCVAVIGAPLLTAIEVATKVSTAFVAPIPVDDPKPVPASDETISDQIWARAPGARGDMSGAVGAAPDTTQAAIRHAFASLSGSWSGDGRMTSGLSNERIRCRAMFKPETQPSVGTLFCAGDRYRFELQSIDLIAQGRPDKQDKPFGGTLTFKGTAEGQVVGVASPSLKSKTEGLPISVELIAGGSSPTLAIHTSVDDVKNAEIRLRRFENESPPITPAGETGPQFR